jgi:hypothetical protein
MIGIILSAVIVFLKAALIGRQLPVTTGDRSP